MARGSVTLGLIALTGSVLAHAVNPNHSIAPELPESTPYGLQISQPQDLLSPEFEPIETNRQVDLGPYVQALEEASLRGGPYSSELLEPLHNLGLAHQERGDPARAMQNFKRALHLARVNDGLQSPAQLPMMGAMINLHLNLGNIDAADQLYRTRYRVQRHAYEPGSEELESATAEYISWQRQAYLQGVGDQPSYHRLLDMHEIHSRDIERLRAGNPGDPALVEHLYDQLKVEYLISRYDPRKAPSLQISVRGPIEGDPVMDGQLEGEMFDRLKKANFRNGLQTLKEIVELEVARGPENSEGIARAHMAVGDWYLWWHRERRGLEHYRSAWMALAEDGRDDTDPRSLFPQPVELPVTAVFHPNGMVAHEDIVARSRVTMDITHDGKPRKIEIVEQEPVGDMGARVMLYNLLGDVRFRPVLRKGEPVPWAGLEREYRYQY